MAPGENIIAVGEDVAAGQTVLKAGCDIRAQEIGAMMALGMTSVHVKRRPRVAIISTGDEIVDPQVNPLPGQVRDVNAHCLGALVSDHGGDAILYGIVPDEPGPLLAIARRAIDDCDMVVITAGSSASTRDLTATTIQALGSPGVLAHGMNIRPGKPTILGCLPGQTCHWPARKSRKRIRCGPADCLACD